MSGLFDYDIRQLFFLALRCLAAVGGFLAGWFLGGPLALLLVKIAFHRTLPRSGVFVAKLTGGVALGLLVFWYLPLGSGGGGGGTGGGTGKGIGPGFDGTGTGKKAGPGEGTAKGGVGTAKGTQAKKILVVELLGGDAVKDGKYYLIDRKAPAVDTAALKAYLEKNKSDLAAVQIVLTEQSVGESHLAVRQLQQMAQANQLPLLIVLPK